MTTLDLETKARAFVTEAGSDRMGGPLYVVGNDIQVKIASADTGGAFAVMEDHTPPLGGPPLHRHSKQDEWWYILEGRYRFEVDGQTIYADAGDTVFAPRGSRHTFQNIGTQPSQHIVTVVPGGLDVFFQEMNDTFPRGTEMDPAIVAPIFARHDLELLGPPLAARMETE